jgi:hypothetical protein
MLIAQHSSDLTKGQNKRFAHLLFNLKITYPNSFNIREPNIPTIPTTFSEIRTKYTEGPNSVWKNLPYPPIHTDVKGHAYVKISDIIEDFLSHGFLPLQPSIHNNHDWIDDITQAPQLVTSLQHAATKFGNEPFYFIAFKEWQDDYESHYARTDTGSVWCKNITLIAEVGTPRHLCTYPIAFSGAQLSHHAVERKFLEDLRQLSTNGHNMFYSSKLGRQIRVHASMYVSLADQKERRPVTCTTQGNSNYHARFGYSIHYKYILPQLPCCAACKDIVSQQTLSAYHDCYVTNPTIECNIASCNDCYAWLYDLEKYPTLSYPAPDNYPTSETDVDGKIKPFRLSFDVLVAACQYTSEKVMNGQWSVSQANTYLAVHCIDRSIREDLTRRAFLKFEINRDTGTPAQIALQEKIAEILEMDPTLLDSWEPPASWTRGVDLIQHLDAPMHLIFHGIIKGICGILKLWLKDRNSSSSFERYYTGLVDIIASLSLEWCKLSPFSGSFAGYLGETYVGLSKLSQWFWSGLEHVSQDPDYVPPNTHYTRWNGDQCKKWLVSRRISIKGLTAAEAKNTIHNLMTRDEGPPPIPPPVGGSIQLVSKMITAMDGMVRILMAGIYPRGGSGLLMLHILDFLNCFDSFKPMTVDRKFPEWLTMYNFLCLLNLPDAVERLGPLRINYEGSSEGEGFIALVKPLLSQGMRKNWQKNLSLRFYRHRSMKLVLRDAHVFIGSQTKADELTQSTFTRKMFQKYKSQQQIQDLFAKGMPISVVILRDGFMGAVVDDRDSWLFVPIRVQHFAKSHWGMNYFHMQIFERDNFGAILRQVVNMGVEADFYRFALMLPLLGIDKYTEQNDASWTIVGSEYERLGMDGTLQGLYVLPVPMQQDGTILAPVHDGPPSDARASDSEEEDPLPPL